MRPTLDTLIGLLVRHLDDARRRLQGWRSGAQGSGVDRGSIVGLVVPRLRWDCPSRDVRGEQEGEL